MDRRFLIASIATFAAAPLLVSRTFAQTTPAPAANPAPAPGAAPQLSTARQNHIKDTLTVGSLSLMLSRIAQPKIAMPRLKQFIEFEIAEQETIASILKTIQNGESPSGAAPSPSDAEVMQNLDAAGQSAVEKLRQTTGVALDREYLRAEIEGHNRLLQIQEAYLRTPDNLDETNVAKLAKGMIKEHLALLADMTGTGGQRASTTRPTVRQ
jgi:putative membrane protein